MNRAQEKSVTNTSQFLTSLVQESSAAMMVFTVHFAMLDLFYPQKLAIARLNNVSTEMRFAADWLSTDKKFHEPRMTWQSILRQSNIHLRVQSCFTSKLFLSLFCV